MEILGGLGGQEMILVVLVLILVFLLPLLALIDVVRSDFRGPNDKLIWVVIIVFMNLLGAILYLTIG